MLRQVSQVGEDYSLKDFLAAGAGMFTGPEPGLAQDLARYLSLRNIFFVNSGMAAFQLILGALQQLSRNKEVILPAYTAPSLVPIIQSCGLRPVLCDINLADFNIDLDLLPQAVSADTLCIVPTYLFGLGIKGVQDLKKKYPGIFIVEDCAQSMGTVIGGKPSGSFSDISFFSFNRGKNLPTYGGGFIATNSDPLAQLLKEKTSALPRPGLLSGALLPVKMVLFALAVRPVLHYWGYPLISFFKERPVPPGEKPTGYSGFQAGMARSLMRRAEELTRQRYRKGMKLVTGLSACPGLIVPSIPAGTIPAFSRVPVIFKEIAAKEKAKKMLARAGIDTSSMYGQPLHHIFALGYGPADFPQADYCAERILTLPVHSLVREEDIKNMVRIIKETAT
jgi:perosamine synthetase